MRIVSMSTEAMAALPTDGPSEGRHGLYIAAAQAIRNDLNAPVELLGVSKVNYLEKSDQYTVTFTGQERSVTLKATDEVAMFIAANIREHGCWQGRIEGGVLVDAYLVRA